MHGFFIKYGVKADWQLSSFGCQMLRRDFSHDSFTLEQVTLPKFVADKVWYSDGEVLIAVEGVLFNLSELKQEYNEDSAGKLLKLMYRQQGVKMVNRLRGTFAVVIYDIKKEQCYVLNDQTGSHLLFVCEHSGGVLVASDLLKMQCVIRHPLSRSFAATMLTYGYSPICETPVEGVRRIGAGEMLRIDADGAHVEHYHTFTNNSVPSKSLSHYIDDFELLFQRAVCRILQKNKEYGLMNFMPLSAGLDSRMTVIVAHELRLGDIHNFTYSQSDFYDQQIPQEIASFLGNEWLFRPLDGGDYLANVDGVIGRTEGLIQFSGAAQTECILPMLPTEKIGVIATGMLGDIIANSYTKHAESVHYIAEGAESKQILHLLPDNIYTELEHYRSRELYYLYVRGFYCANLGSPIVFQHFTESVSPFCDVDVLQYCLNIPSELRWNNRFYDAWILRYHPEAARWKHNGVAQIGNRERMVQIGGRKMLLAQVPKRIVMKLLKELHIANLYKETVGHSMNPEDSWITQNESLKHAFDTYFDNNISRLSAWSDIDEAARRLYHEGTAMERMQVLTLLAALKRYEV